MVARASACSVGFSRRAMFIAKQEITGPLPQTPLVLKSMATTKKKKPVKSADEGFLTTAAQAIGSTLGQLAKKAGVVPPPSKPAPKKKTVTKKKAAAKKTK
jgi:hypothetical protein